MDKENMELSQKVGDALKLKRYIPSGYLGEGKHIRTFDHPDFARDMNTAWLLVEAMEDAGYYYKREKYLGQNEIVSRFVLSMWECDQWESRDTHTPTAILMAAAKALGVYDE